MASSMWLKIFPPLISSRDLFRPFLCPGHLSIMGRTCSRLVPFNLENWPPIVVVRLGISPTAPSKRTFCDEWKNSVECMKNLPPNRFSGWFCMNDWGRHLLFFRQGPINPRTGRNVFPSFRARLITLDSFECGHVNFSFHTGLNLRC